MGIISHVAALKERIDKQVVVKKARSGGARWRSLCDCFPSLPHRLPSQGRVFQKVICLLRREDGIERPEPVGLSLRSALPDKVVPDFSLVRW